MSKPFKHLSAGFLRAMEEIGELGYVKHGENSFQHMVLTGNIQRKIARHSTTEILQHAQQHAEEYRLGLPHDYFNDLLHQLAAGAFNLMVEAQFAGITNEPPPEESKKPVTYGEIHEEFLCYKRSLFAEGDRVGGMDYTDWLTRQLVKARNASVGSD